MKRITQKPGWLRLQILNSLKLIGWVQGVVANSICGELHALGLSSLDVFCLQVDQRLVEANMEVPWD